MGSRRSWGVGRGGEVEAHRGQPPQPKPPSPWCWEEHRQTDRYGKTDRCYSRARGMPRRTPRPTLELAEREMTWTGPHAGGRGGMSVVFAPRRWGAGRNRHRPFQWTGGGVYVDPDQSILRGEGGRILNQPILCFEGRGRSSGSIHSAVGERDRATTLVLFPHTV